MEGEEGGYGYELMVSLSIYLLGDPPLLQSRQTRQFSCGQAGNWAFVAKHWVPHFCFCKFMQIAEEKSLYFIQLTEELAGLLPSAGSVAW